MLNELRTRINEHSRNFRKELRNMKKNQAQLKNTGAEETEVENILEINKNRLGDMGECISDLQDKIMGKKKKNPIKAPRKKNEDILRDCWDNIKDIKDKMHPKRPIPRHIIKIVRGKDRILKAARVKQRVTTRKLP